jgi:hypothetical protein
MSPQKVIVLDLSCHTNPVIAAEREQYVREKGHPAYTTSVGWLGYSDEKIRQLCREACKEGWTTFKMKVRGKHRQWHVITGYRLVQTLLMMCDAQLLFERRLAGKISWQWMQIKGALFCDILFAHLTDFSDGMSTRRSGG